MYVVKKKAGHGSLKYATGSKCHTVGKEGRNQFKYLTRKDQTAPRQR